MPTNGQKRGLGAFFGFRRADPPAPAQRPLTGLDSEKTSRTNRLREDRTCEPFAVVSPWPLTPLAGDRESGGCHGLNEPIRTPDAPTGQPAVAP